MSFSLLVTSCTLLNPTSNVSEGKSEENEKNDEKKDVYEADNKDEDNEQKPMDDETKEEDTESEEDGEVQGEITENENQTNIPNPVVSSVSISINEVTYDVTCNWSGQNAS